MPESLKIAYYLSRFPRLSETFILREMCLLRETGFDVQVFSILPPLPSSSMHKQVEIMLPYAHYSPALLSLDILLAQFYYLLHAPGKYFRALGRLIWQTAPVPKTLAMALLLFPKSVYFARVVKDLEIDHIHAHFVWLNGVAAQVASDLLGIPLTLHAHAWDIFRRNRECVRRQLALAQGIITVSEYHRQFLAQLADHGYPVDIHIVHYGLDPQEFKPSATNKGDHETRIISVGRLVEKKGFKTLVKACAILAKKGYAFDCSIVGEGHQAELQKQIDALGLREYVSLQGAKTIEEILELYQQSDIFALPCVIAESGDRDGMPNVLLEAMAMQLPVITTPVTGNTELVQDGINGLLIREADASSLALGIERLINDPALRQQLGKHARQTILDSFDIHQTAMNLASIFQSMQASKNSDRR